MLINVDDTKYTKNEQINEAEKQIKKKIGLYFINLDDIVYSLEKNQLIIPLEGNLCSKIRNFRFECSNKIFGFPWFNYDVETTLVSYKITINGVKSYQIHPYYANGGFDKKRRGVFTDIKIETNQIIFDSFEDDEENDYMIKIDISEIHVIIKLFSTSQKTTVSK